MDKLRKKHQKTFDSIQKHPLPSNLGYKEFEALILALGYEREEFRGGSTAMFTDGEWTYAYHRPHPRKEVDKGAIAAFTKQLKERGIL